MSIRSLGNPIAKYKAVWERTGVGALPIPTAFSATGGTKTTSGSNVIHSFTSPGTFTVDNAPPTFAVEYLMVGGGGGGGSGSGGAGGGAGGYITAPGFSVASGEYAISVGAGGEGAPAAPVLLLRILDLLLPFQP